MHPSFFRTASRVASNFPRSCFDLVITTLGLFWRYQHRLRHLGLVSVWVFSASDLFCLLFLLLSFPFLFPTDTYHTAGLFFLARNHLLVFSFRPLFFPLISIHIHIPSRKYNRKSLFTHLPRHNKPSGIFTCTRVYTDTYITPS